MHPDPSTPGFRPAQSPAPTGPGPPRLPGPDLRPDHLLAFRGPRRHGRVLLHPDGPPLQALQRTGRGL